MRLFVCELNRDMPGRKNASAVARRLLSYAVLAYWGVPCPEIYVDDAGKPRFVGAENMHFSISHTRTHALVGVSEHELGVDIETERPVPERLSLRLFSEATLRELSFFEGWCLRESIYKLTGRGSLLSMELRRDGSEIICPFEGVRCMLSHAVPGCTLAAACCEGAFPEEIEPVVLPEILP